MIEQHFHNPLLFEINFMLLCAILFLTKITFACLIGACTFCKYYQFDQRDA